MAMFDDDDVTRATHGPLLLAWDRRALAVCVVVGLIGWVGIVSFVGRGAVEDRPAENSSAAGSSEITIATTAITDADHPCGVVVNASRLKDGSIRAVCSNGEAYRVSVLQGGLVALRCSAAARLGVSGC